MAGKAVSLKPPDIKGAIMKALDEAAPILKNQAIGHLNQALKRRSGRLASSIYARTKRIRNGGRLTVGTPVLYGRFWEYGFLRGGKSVRGLVRGAGRSRKRRTAGELARLIKRGAKYYRRPWLRPSANEAMPEVVRRVEMYINDAIKQYSGSATIDIKFG
jgi:Bacteriophage HK97-gp10, putative tail-component